jgi:hypothetical protein
MTALRAGRSVFKAGDGGLGMTARPNSLRSPDTTSGRPELQNSRMRNGPRARDGKARRGTLGYKGFGGAADATPAAAWYWRLLGFGGAGGGFGELLVIFLGLQGRAFLFRNIEAGWLQTQSQFV